MIGHSPQLSDELLGILARAHPNVLLIGPQAITERAIGALRHHVRLPIVTWSPREGRPLPTEGLGTLAIPAVDTADVAQQLDLCVWREARARVQVLSSSVTPLLPLVTHGVFLERLYYMLNQLYIDLAATE